MKSRLNLILMIAALGAAVITQVNFGDYEVIEESYTVNQGDTFWGICEEYHKKNTYDRVYILAFMEEVKSYNNLDSSCQLYPGQKIKIRYKVPKE